MRYGWNLNFLLSVAKNVPKLKGTKERTSNWRKHVLQHIIHLNLSCLMDLLTVFRAGIMDFKHEVSSKECGQSLPLLHWNESDNVLFARTIYYHIKRDFSPPLPLHGPELNNHSFWCREQSLFQECGRDGVFVKVRTEAKKSPSSI